MHSKTLICAIALILTIPAVTSAALFSEWIISIINDGNPNWAFDFNLQWTEYLAGEQMGQWTYDFNNGVNQTPAPVPLPTSGWMLLSGLALFIGIRRHSSG